MLFYFKLQFTILNRKLTDFGVPPIVGYTLITVIFIMASNHLFASQTNAPYIYTAIALAITFANNDKGKNDFIKNCYTTKTYYFIKALQNILICLPFAAILLYNQTYFLAILLIPINCLIAFIPINVTSTKVIPTPFGKTPFEFTVGFRKKFLPIMLTYLIAYIAIYVDNYNLGIFALIANFLIAILFYNKVENEYFVWSHSVLPKDFLILKIKIALTNSSLLSLPILFFMSIFFSNQISFLLLCVFVCHLYLVASVLLKYSNFPNTIDFPKTLLFGITVVFPPLLIGVIPFYYKSATKKLSNYLK